MSDETITVNKADFLELLHLADEHLYVANPKTKPNTIYLTERAYNEGYAVVTRMDAQWVAHENEKG